MTDRELAAGAARAAGRVAADRFGGAVAVSAKLAATDVVSDVDREAEAAAIALIARERPADGYVGEEGAGRAGERTWVVDALDGTLNYLQGLPGWCAAVALEDARGPVAAAVCDPIRQELYTAVRGEGADCNGAPLAVAPVADLDAAVVATFLHAPKRDLAGVVPTLTELLVRAGSVRMTGSGTLELAHVAAGRLHGWIQPATYRWDWVPGALLVTEAGGRAERVQGDPEWCIAASHELFEALAELPRTP